MSLTKVVLLCYLVSCFYIEWANADTTHTVRGVIIARDGAVIPQFDITVKHVSQEPELHSRKRFKNGEFTIGGLAKGRYQLQISAPLYVPTRLDFDFNSAARPTEYTIVILHRYRNESQFTPDAAYTVSAKNLQEKIPAKAKDAYTKAVELHREGRLQDALIEYGKALQAYPNFVPALGDLSAILMLFNQPESALTFLRRAHEIDGRNVIVNLNIGIALTAQNDYSGAMKFFKNVLDKYPRLALAHYHIARVQYLQKKYEDAERSVRYAIENDPHLVQASVLMINISLKQNKYDQAREALSHVRQAMDNKIISKFIDEQLSTLGL